MNLLGRLLIVLIFIGSIILASFSVVLYATHTNWKKRADEVQQVLQKKEKDFNELRKQREDMEAALKLENSRLANRVTALKIKESQLTEENDAAKVKLAELEQERVQAVAAVQTSQETAERLRLRLDGVSKALLDSQNDWVSMSTELVKMTDEAHGLAIDLANYQSTAVRLAEDYQKAMEVLRIHGLVPEPTVYSTQPPAGIRGVVTEIRPGGNVELSIGSDSGLVKGHQLDVICNREGRSSYVGKIEVTHSVADRAVARVMPEFRRGSVQTGDEVMYIEVNELVAH